MAADNSLVASYTYDYRGLRITKTIGTATVKYHWDDEKRLVRESDSSGNTLSLYIYNIADQLVAFEKGGAMYYVHTNHRGDILGITDVNRNQVATYKYGPWGEFISKTGSIDIPFRYAGYYYDNETSLYYLKARYYSPNQGRFLTRDSISYSELFEPQSLNLYAYAQGNPNKFVDPDGHFAWAAGLVFFIPGVNVVATVALATVAVGAGIYVGVQASKSKPNTSSLPSQGTVSAGVKGAPPVDAGKQGKHVPGHPNFQEGKSSWPPGQTGVKETQEAWTKGRSVPGNNSVRVDDKSGIKVHINSKGNIHGYPTR